VNLVLIGYRGTGKSAVAAHLGRATGRRVISTDAEIEARLGQSIAEYVAEAGWPAFRDVETEVVRWAAAQDGLVIDTGGGAPEREENVAALRENGLVIWLTASEETIARRLRNATNRPSLTNQGSFLDEIGAVLARRNPLYAAAADHSVATDERTPAQVARVVLEMAGEAQ